MSATRTHIGIFLLVAAQLVIAAACSDSRRTDSNALAPLLGERWPLLAAKLSSAATGAARDPDGEGFRVLRAPVRALLPAMANGPLEIQLAESGESVRVVRAGSTGTRGVLDRGVVIYAGGGVDSIVFGTREGIEELLVVHRELETIAYDVDLPSGHALRQSSPRSAEIVDAEGIARLRVAAPRGWDAHGSELALELRATGQRLELIAPRGVPLPLLLDPIWTTTALLAMGRGSHTATLLPSGKILVAGGRVVASAEASCELFDPLTSTFSHAGKMATARADHTATLLRSGEVLLIGGGAGPGKLATTELYDPGTGAFTAGPSMTVGRGLHTATLLADGRVLVAGGTNAADRGEIYDPKTKKFSSTGKPAAARRRHTATRLPTGDVVLIGGSEGSDGTDTLASPVVEIFDVATATFRTGPGNPTARADHTATLTPGGQILVASGRTAPAGTPTPSADIYDPGNGQVTVVAMGARVGHAAVLLDSGLVLLAGGGAGDALEQFDWQTGLVTARSESLADNRSLFTATVMASGNVALIGGTAPSTGGPGAQLQSVEIFASPAGALTKNVASLTKNVIAAKLAMLPNGNVVVSGGSPAPSTGIDVYDPVTKSFVLHREMLSGRRSHTATSLGNGRILLAGGSDDLMPDDTAELFDGVNVTATGKLRTKRAGHVAVRLTSGKVLLAGGNALEASAELYDPATGTFALAKGKMTGPRVQPVAALLPCGEVLVAGGVDAQGASLATAETYDPVTDRFTATGAMAVARSGHAASLLGTGKVLVAGGSVASAELYDPVTRKFRTTSTPMTVLRTAASATLLPSGKVVLLGGTFAGTAVLSDEIYDASLDRFVPCANSVLGFQGAAAILLTTGDVLSVGGFSQGRFFGAAECALWSASTPPDPTRAPSLLPLPAGARASSTLQVSGARLSGGHEAGSGATQSSSSDAPVALWMPTSGGLLTGAFTPWDRTSATWNLPPSALTGRAMLFVATGGVYSQAQLLDVAPASIGARCVHDLDCGSVHCADGVCCESACDGVCMACSAKKRAGGRDGACLPIPPPSDPDGECPAQDVSACGRSGGCGGRGACATYAEGTTCGPSGRCTKGVCASSGSCADDATQRDAQGNVRSCLPFRCRDGACLTRCGSTADCASGMQCEASGDCGTPLLDDVAQPGCVCALGLAGGSPGRSGGPFVVALTALAAAALRRRSRQR